MTGPSRTVIQEADISVFDQGGFSGHSYFYKFRRVSSSSKVDISERSVIHVDMIANE